MARSSVAPITLHKVHHNQPVETDDLLAVEEPMEIRLGFGPLDGRQQHSLAVTMRTPGHDFELALGFLYSEGVIRDSTDLLSIRYCIDVGRQERENIVRVELKPECTWDRKQLERNFYASSSCGICGKSSIEAVRETGCTLLPTAKAMVSADLISRLPEKLLGKQAVFNCTGGLHAAGLFDLRGNLLLMREDVGRHNALDKLIGAALHQESILLNESVALMSGRVGFELVQKALKARIPILAAVGAPSSLAVELAAEAGMTLMGFVRDGSFNIYTGAERLR